MKKILDYLPPIIKELEQIILIANIEDLVIKSQWKTTNMIVNDQWIETSTERGIARREKILNIYPYPESTLEERRTRVIALWFSYIPYTYRTLKKVLDLLCGIDTYTLELKANIYFIELNAKPTKINISKDIINLVNEMIPANLIFLYNLHFQFEDLDFFIGTDLTSGSHDIIECEEYNFNN